MSDPFDKRVLTINGMAQIYDDIDDLAVDIELHHSGLRRLSENLGDEIDDRTLVRIETDAVAQRDRIDGYNAWKAEILLFRKTEIAELRDALRNLPPSPFEEG